MSESGHTRSSSSWDYPKTGVESTHGWVLYLDEVTVSFDGFRALNELSLTIDAGELRCIIGPNGAGKTTMMDVITGKDAARFRDCFLWR